MKRIATLFLLLLFVLSSSVFAAGIKILSVNDSHSNLSPGGPRNFDLSGTVGGIARIATIVNQARTQDSTTLFLHAGDASMGDVFFGIYYAVPEFQFLNQLKLDAMVLGNHEFDLTPSALIGSLQMAMPQGGFDILCANMIAEDSSVAYLKSRVKKSIVKKVGNVNVGIFGMTTPESNSFSSPSPVIISDDLFTIASEQIVDLKAKNCDVIIMLSHLGIELDKAIATNIPGIDIVIGGHDHLALTVPEEITHAGGKSTFIVQTSGFYRQIGSMTYDFTNNFLDYQLINVDTSVAEDLTTKIMVESLQQQCDSILARGPIFTAQLAYANEDFAETVKKPLEVGKHDTPVGNLVADAFLNAFYGTADIAIVPCGITSQMLYKGPLVVDDILRMIGYVFIAPDGSQHYRMATFNLPGMAIIAGLNATLSYIDYNDDMLVQVAGMRYKYAVDAPRESRLIAESLTVNGQPIDPLKSYKIVTNEYVAALFASMLGGTPDSLQFYNDQIDASVVLIYAAQRQLLNPVVEGRVEAIIATSVNKNNTINSFDANVYPCPANDLLNGVIRTNKTGNCSVKLINALGNSEIELMNKDITEGTTPFSFNIESVPAGFYFLKISSGQDIISKKVIITK